MCIWRIRQIRKSLMFFSRTFIQFNKLDCIGRLAIIFGAVEDISPQDFTILVIKVSFPTTSIHFIFVLTTNCCIVLFTKK